MKNFCKTSSYKGFACIHRLRAAQSKFGVLFSVIWISLLFHPVISDAAFIEQVLGNTQTMSFANTAAAYPPGHMSVHYNPAGLSTLKSGKMFSQGFALAKIDRTYKFTPDPDFILMNQFTAKDDDPISNKEGKVKYGRIFIPGVGPINLPVLAAPVPLGISYREPGSKLTYGAAMYAPYAGGLYHAKDDPACYQGQAVYLQHIVATPAVSYKVNDYLSVGFAVSIGTTALGLKTYARAPNEMVAMTRVISDATSGFDLDKTFFNVDIFPLFGGGIGPFDKIAETEVTMRDSFTPSFNVGVLWQPVDWFAFGTVYQSPVYLDLEGKYTFQYSKDFQRVSEWLGGNAIIEAFAKIFDIGTQKLENESGRATLEGFSFPQRIQSGIMVKPIKKLRLLCDVHWANWATTEEYRITFDQKIQAIRLLRLLGYTGGQNVLLYQKDMKNSTHFSFGVEYELLDWMALRAGYEDRKSSSRDDLFDLFSLPDIDHYGAGVSLKLSHDIVLDLGVGYLTYKNYRVPNDTSLNFNSNNFARPVYNPYAGQNLETSFNAYLTSMNITMPFEVLQETVGNLLKF